MAVSADGRQWKAAIVIENTPGSEFSSPAVIQTGHGFLHFSHAWKRRRIRHEVLDPSRLKTSGIVEGQCPQ